jgi:hypothetical protein
MSMPPSLSAAPVMRSSRPRDGCAAASPSPVEEALLPLRGTLDDQALRNLVLAIRSATGIESLVWLTDVAGLDRGDARELMRWTAQALLQAAAGNPPPVPTAQREPVRGEAAPSP